MGVCKDIISIHPPGPEKSNYLVLTVIAFMAAPQAASAAKATVIQELTGYFDNPEGSVVGLDSRSIFISNTTSISGSFAFTPGAGYISKFIINNQGE